MSTPVGRFAPTPSGFLHPGNLLCAMLAYLSVRSAGGVCLLRIEDLDQTRCPPRLVQQCLSDLSWLGFRWDGPLVLQSQRTDAYRRAFGRLQDLGLTYPCFCTRAQRTQILPPTVGIPFSSIPAPAEISPPMRLHKSRKPAHPRTASAFRMKPSPFLIICREPMPLALPKIQETLSSSVQMAYLPTI